MPSSRSRPPVPPDLSRSLWNLCRTKPDNYASSLSPVHQILHALPNFPTLSTGKIDYTRADLALLLQTAEAADTLTRSLHLGTSAIGQLMAHAAPELEDGTVSSDAVEALGWLLSALGEMGAQMAVLALQCARAAAAQATAGTKE